jgi:translation initiation factor 1
MSVSKSKLVYSTDPQAMAPDETKSAQKEIGPKPGQVVKIQRETKGRGGKTVTAVMGLSGNLKPLQKELQKHCGTGGSSKNGRIEIQGDQGHKIKAYLEGRGYKVKLSGGY